MTTTQIHGLPTPPLGYRLLNKGEKPSPGSAKVWQSVSEYWADAICFQDRPLAPHVIYAIPLNDGYEYHEAGTTVIQVGDECQVPGGSGPQTWAQHAGRAFGQTNKCALRRPKAKPPTYAERQAACGLKVGDRVKLIRDWTCKEHAIPPTSKMSAQVGNVGTICKVYNHGFDIHFGPNVPVFSGYPYFVLEKVTPLAPGRNINGLTEEQVGVADGWRLITEGEYDTFVSDAERFMIENGAEWTVWGAARCDCNLPLEDYRTKAPLPVEKGEETPERIRVVLRTDGGSEIGGMVATYELLPESYRIATQMLAHLAGLKEGN